MTAINQAQQSTRGTATAATAGSPTPTAATPCSPPSPTRCSPPPASQPGEPVLDIGCGCGATTLAAAHAAAPGGAATGIDLSAPMLDVARRRARDRRLTDTCLHRRPTPRPTRFEPPTFDLAISRFGTMFFDDPVAAFTNIAAALRPGGRLCIATWQPLERQRLAHRPRRRPPATTARCPTPTRRRPGMFAQSDPEPVTRVLRNAGWPDISSSRRTVTLRLGADAEDATDYLADTGVGRTILESIDEAAQAEAIRAVTETLAHHAGPNGVLLGAGVLIINATA